MMKLTKSQRETIMLLGRETAIGKGSGITANAQGLSPGTASTLVRMGLCLKAVIRNHRAQRTVYWLTPDGSAWYARMLQIHQIEDAINKMRFPDHELDAATARHYGVEIKRLRALVKALRDDTGVNLHMVTLGDKNAGPPIISHVGRQALAKGGKP